MVPIWVNQTNNPGLGDFVRITPSILTLSIQNKYPIPVFFDNKDMELIFKDCPYMEILKEKPSNPCLLSTLYILNKNIKYGDIRNKYYGVHFTLHGHEKMSCPFLELQTSIKLPYKNPVAIFNGVRVKEWYKNHKDIGNNNRSYIIKSLLEKGFTPIILGNKNDKDLFWSKIDISGCVDMLGKTKLSEAVSIINQCQFFVSNDTCLYHFASSLMKKGLVFWRDTKYSLDGNLFDSNYIFHYQNEDISTYPVIVDSFLSNIDKVLGET